MDHIDTANDYAEKFTEEALAQRTRYTGKSADSCLDCGNPIPDERREAIAGCNTCFECASVRERRMV